MSSLQPIVKEHSSSTQPYWAKRYRQVEYNNGKAVHITESRRRLPSDVGAELTTSTHRNSPVIHSTGYRTDTNIGLSQEQVTFNMSTSEDFLASGAHVTMRGSALGLSKKKPIIVQAKTPAGKAQKKSFLALEPSELPTPPRTPNIERLPTPDLSDSELDERPFCNCCPRHIIKFCASCGNNIRRH